MSTVASYFVKVGRLRFYSGDSPNPYWFEVPFRDMIELPVDRGRPADQIILDRGRLTADMHYITPPDDPILAPSPFRTRIRLLNTEPNYSKIMTLVRSAGGLAKKVIGIRHWTNAKGTTQLFNNDPLGQSLVTLPRFADSEKHAINVEALWQDPQSLRNLGFKLNEVYFPPDQRVQEAVDSLMLDLNGEVYGATSIITSFTAGIES